MNDVRVALVTGSNKGIGYAIVRGLCKRFQGDVFLTARNEELGKKAVSDLNAEGLHPKFHQLDINDQKSIEQLAVFLKQEYGGLDILVNNAGMAYKVSSTAPFSEQAEMTVKTNFTGTQNVCEALFPLLRPHARVVNVSSAASYLSLFKNSYEMRERFTDENLTMEQLKSLMEQFVSATQNGKHIESGFSNSAYGMSKVGVTCMSVIQQRDMDKDSRQDIIVNACCPGVVKTDMSSKKGCKTLDEGADTPLYLALLPPNTTTPKGNFVTEKTVMSWNSSKWSLSFMLLRQLLYIGTSYAYSYFR